MSTYVPCWGGGGGGAAFGWVPLVPVFLTGGGPAFAFGCGGGAAQKDTLTDREQSETGHGPPH